LWFHSSGTTPALAFADFMAPILEAKSAKFKMTTDIAHGPTAEMMFLAPNRIRTEVHEPHQPLLIEIEDGETGKTLTLLTGNKLATLTTVVNRPQEASKNIFAQLRSMMLDARGNSDYKRESLGKKEIDGRQAAGYRLTGRGLIMNLWGDPKTGLPIRIETRALGFKDPIETVLSGFVFNVDVDKSSFSLEPPAGYRVETNTVDGTPASEADLVEVFRRYSQRKGGAFPKSLDMDLFLQARQEIPLGTQELGKLSKGLAFVFEELPLDADAHYAGKGVVLGAAGTPIFWYRPKGTKKYRVIYADLSVRDVATPPSMPQAQQLAVPTLSK